MKTAIMSAALALSLLPSLAQAEDGKAIFLRTCATCHFLQRDPARRDEMVAPPIDMMSAHVREAVRGDRDAFIRRVVDYIRAPAEGKSVDALAVQRFGLMPAIGDTFPDLTDADLRAVAGWMFDAHANVQLPPPAMRGRM
jgi:cytochrome c5